MNPKIVARGLGWFSIALGVAELVMTRGLARGLGMRGQQTLLRAYGLREVANGVAILQADRQAPWLWARVGGDALDIATLAAGMAGNAKKANVAIALGAVAGVTALDVMTAQAVSNKERRARQPVRDYSRRSGFSRPIEEMRGIARDAAVPRDMRAPEAMRPVLH
jgi:hypothetical protein